jgi:hypothetical protein
MNFDELLEERKALFEDHRALIVLDDKAMRRYVLCWGAMLVQRWQDYPMGHTLADLWACVRVDFQALADLTGESLPQVMGHFRQAQGLELIYPDGSIPEAVTKVLKRRLKAEQES